MPFSCTPQTKIHHFSSIFECEVRCILDRQLGDGGRAVATLAIAFTDAEVAYFEAAHSYCTGDTVRISPGRDPSVPIAIQSAAQFATGGQDCAVAPSSVPVGTQMGQLFDLFHLDRQVAGDSIVHAVVVLKDSDGVAGNADKVAAREMEALNMQITELTKQLSQQCGDQVSSRVILPMGSRRLGNSSLPGPTPELNPRPTATFVPTASVVLLSNPPRRVVAAQGSVRQARRIKQTTLPTIITTPPSKKEI